MRSAISRYGARVLPDTEQIADACKERGEYIQGPQIAEFERAFERRAGSGHRDHRAYGRIAFYYMLKALDLPPGSEIIFPSLTFWVVPELAKVAGLTVVFADVDPKTFNLDPASVERMITDKTRAIVPTHLYGLPVTWTGCSRSRRGTTWWCSRIARTPWARPTRAAPSGHSAPARCSAFRR
jgi:dTDP-4-amino-4,6-dideoxygalactose transaminase